MTRMREASIMRIVGLCVGLSGAALAQTEAVTLGTLLDEMTDAERLTRLAPQPYRLYHASSCDRLAVQPNTPNWFANMDWSQWQRVETVEGRTEYVLLDTEGPGAIVRFWATIMGSGNTLRIYLDGSATPLIQGSLTDLLGRQGWVGSPLSFVAPDVAGTGTGHNLYLPIPFQQRCKVTVETPSWRLYYNIDYRLYDPGTVVETFPSNGLSVYAAECARTSATLLGGHPAGAATTACHRIEGRLSWGGQQRSVTLSGPAAIRRLRVKLAAPDVPQALRSTLLEMDVDDERNAVQVPVGDFFCTGYTVTNGCTWMSEAFPDGSLEAYWVMPFGERATIRLVNHGMQDVQIETCEVWTGPYLWETNSMHFHAAWREYPFEDTVAWQGEDLNYVTLRGCGRLVGDTLSVFNDASTTPHPYANWWGEGDEKIYVDGEVFPSHFGTGTEDYYGYAWCLPQTFNTPFIAQPTGAGNDRTGNTVNTRLRLLDDIAYRTELRFDMELLSQRTGRHRYAPTVFWYASPGGTCFTPDPLAKAQLPVPRATSGIEMAPIVCPIGMRVDVEAMTVARNTGGALSCVTSNGMGLSGENCVRWQNCAVGSRVEFGFPVSFTGRCALVARVLSGPSAGTVRVRVNEQTVTNGVDLYAPLTAPVLLQVGTHLLRPGLNTLTFEVTGLPAGAEEGAFAFDTLENEGVYSVARALPVLRARLEGEDLPVLTTCGGMAVASNSLVSSGGKCAVWAGAQTGGQAVFQLVSECVRQVPLRGVFLCATNGARCEVAVNGVTVCQGLDLCSTESRATNVFLGTQHLTRGTNDVTVTVTGCGDGVDPSDLTVILDCVDIGSLYADTLQRQTPIALIGPYEDPDGDGLMNLAEYAFGGDPACRDGVQLWPSPVVLQGEGLVFPVLAYRRRKPVTALPVVGTEGVDLQVDGIVYQVQEKTSLDAGTDWTTTNLFGPTVMSIGTPDEDDGKTVRVRVRTVQPLSNGHPGTRFMRVGLRES